MYIFQKFCPSFWGPQSAAPKPLPRLFLDPSYGPDRGILYLILDHINFFKLHGGGDYGLDRILIVFQDKLNSTYVFSHQQYAVFRLP